MYQNLPGIIAADIVLLPSDQDIEDIILLNKTLHQTSEQQIFLSKTINLPHLSLLMGGLPVDQLDQTKEHLQHFFTNYTPLYLKIDEVVDRNDCASISFKKSDALQSMHETLVKSFRALMVTGVTGEMFISDSPISDSSINYINQYWEKSINNNFWPHITLGYGKLPKSIRIPGAINFDKIALFHLGDHCTCNKSICTYTFT